MKQNFFLTLIIVSFLANSCNSIFAIKFHVTESGSISKEIQEKASCSTAGLAGMTAGQYLAYVGVSLYKHESFPEPSLGSALNFLGGVYLADRLRTIIHEGSHALVAKLNKLNVKHLYVSFMPYAPGLTVIEKPATKSPLKLCTVFLAGPLAGITASILMYYASSKLLLSGDFKDGIQSTCLYTIYNEIFSQLVPNQVGQNDGACALNEWKEYKIQN